MKMKKNRKMLLSSQFLENQYLGSRGLQKQELQKLIQFFQKQFAPDGIDYFSFINQQDFFTKLIFTLNPKLKQFHSSFTRQLAKEESLIWSAIYLGQNPKNIHVFDSSVLNAMKHTDLDKLTVGQLPSFDEPLYFQINQETIIIHPHRVGFSFIGFPAQFCAKRFELMTHNDKVFDKAPISWITLDVYDPDETIADNLKKYQQKMTDIYHNEADKAIIHSLVNKMKVSEEDLKKLLDNTVKDHKTRSYDLIETAIKCLLYYFSSDDVEVDWSNETPAEEIERIKNITNQAKQAVQEHQLKDQGFFKVTHVGRQYAKSENAKQLTAYLSDRTVSPHFRRGHFRSQAYGKEKLLRKIIFIKPTFVNPEGH